jgi:hypothetical protein
MEFTDKRFQLQSLAGSYMLYVYSLITQSTHVYLDLLLHFKGMLTEIFPGYQYFIIQYV